MSENCLLCGRVAELVYAYVSEAYPVRVGSSSLPTPTQHINRVPIFRCSPLSILSICIFYKVIRRSPGEDFSPTGTVHLGGFAEPKHHQGLQVLSRRCHRALSLGQNKRTTMRWFFYFVPRRGLEPPPLTGHAPQACSATNYDTWAKFVKHSFQLRELSLLCVVFD